MELIKQLLEAGVHFGHQSKNWNPKMEKYIFGKKNGVHIVDLEKTQGALKAACDFLMDLSAQGGVVLFVGTKRQAQSVVVSEAKRCGMFYVSHRWLGGLLTNFATIKKSIKRYKELEQMKADGTFSKFTKKEASLLSKEMDKLKKNFEGIMDMQRMPQALFIIDPKTEDIAVREASTLAIPICALIDTNSNPDKIDYPIPGNDDAIKSVTLITSLIADSIIEGRKRFLDYLGKELVKETKVAEQPVPPPADAPDVIKEKAEELEELVRSGEKDESKAKIRPKGEGRPSDEIKRRPKR